jgi:DNA-directed RNA polymerase sigma subunit (sigma70/sigma32)
MSKQAESEQEHNLQNLSPEQEQESLQQALWLEDVQQNNNQLSLFLLVMSNMVVISNIAKCYHKKHMTDREKDMVLNEAVGIFEDVCYAIDRHDPELCLLEEFLHCCQKKMSSDIQRKKRHKYYAEAREYGAINMISMHLLLDEEGDIELIDVLENPNQQSVYEEAYLLELPVRVLEMLNAAIPEENIRTMVKLYYISDVGVKDIATMFGLDKQRVRERISRAMRCLKILAHQYISE